jgi:hypothetical protein
MRWLTIALLTVSLATIAASADDPTALVKEAAAGWQLGAVKQDPAALKRFLADDLQYAHAGGQVQNKEQYMAAVLKGPPRYETFTFADLKIQFYGKAAVLTAYCDVKMIGQESFRVRTLQVYVENNGQWQMAAHQSTRMGR